MASALTRTLLLPPASSFSSSSSRRATGKRQSGKFAGPQRTGARCVAAVLTKPKQVAAGQKFTIATLPGDGQGPEVMEVAKQVLAATSVVSGVEFEFKEGLIGKAALKAGGDGLPEETLQLCRESDAVLLGGISSKPAKEGGVPLRSQVLAKMRSELGLFWQLSPAKGFAELQSDYLFKPASTADLMLIREISGGLYTGRQGREKDNGDVRAYSTSEYTISQVERIGRAALETARQRSRRITSVDLSNYLEVSMLWREVLDQLRDEEFPDVELKHELADSFAAHLVTVPQRYDVIVLPNLLGDVLVEAARGMTGGTRMAPNAWLGELGTPGVFGFPGSFEVARQRTASPVGNANPLGLVRSVSMMLRYQLGLPVVADLTQQAISAVLADGCRTYDMPASDSSNFLSCSEMGDRLVQAMEYFQSFKVAGNPAEVGE